MMTIDVNDCGNDLRINNSNTSSDVKKPTKECVVMTMIDWGDDLILINTASHEKIASKNCVVRRSVVMTMRDGILSEDDEIGNLIMTAASISAVCRPSATDMTVTPKDVRMKRKRNAQVSVKYNMTTLSDI
jgi:hypothetical protein